MKAVSHWVATVSQVCREKAFLTYCHHRENASPRRTQRRNQAGSLDVCAIKRVSSLFCGRVVRLQNR